MKHLKSGRKLSRKRGERKALLKILATNLILHRKITTTRAKAKEVAPFFEHLVNVAKKENLASKKKIHSIFSKKVAEIFIKELGPKYKDRSGGYTRITKLGSRKGDAAEIVKLELV